MTAPLYKRSVCVLWITLCLFQVGLLKSNRMTVSKITKCYVNCRLTWWASRQLFNRRHGPSGCICHLVVILVLYMGRQVDRGNACSERVNCKHDVCYDCYHVCPLWCKIKRAMYKYNNVNSNLSRIADTFETKHAIITATVW